MSFDALAWAVKAQPGSAADKLVLLGLADRHNTEYDAAYPSVDWLVDFSGLDRKTVIAAISRLIEGGLIADTGRRVGKTKQVKVYELSIPKVEQFQKRNSSVFSGKGSQKRDTDTIKEPVTSEDKSSSAGGSYAFKGKVIRLKLADLERWRKTFHSIPDIVAELTSIDGWLADNPGAVDRKKWFQPVQGMLNKKHQDRLKPDAKNDPYAYRREPLRV